VKIRLILSLAIILILFAIEYVLLGAGISFFLIGSAMQTISSFTQIGQGALTGTTGTESAVSFIINLVITIAILLVYFFIASFISKLILKE
jgi:hypothetical protein